MMDRLSGNHGQESVLAAGSGRIQIGAEFVDSSYGGGKVVVPFRWKA